MNNAERSQGGMAWAPIAAVLIIVLVVGITWLNRNDAGSGPATRAGAEQASISPGLPPEIARDIAEIRALPRVPLRSLATADGQGMLGESLTGTGEQPEPQVVAAELDRLHASDAPDPSGGREPADALWKMAQDPAIQSTGIGPETLEADCRQARCRVVASFARSGDAEDWANMYMTTGGNPMGNARIVFVPSLDGGMQARVYGVRK